MFGEFKYPPDFDHFDYVNPNASKGGILVLPSDRDWRAFNPENVNTPGAGIILGAAPMLYDSLFSPADDELGSFYGNLAERIKISNDFTRVQITIRPEAHWHDGVPVTATDVVFTFNYLRNKLDRPRKISDNLQSSYEVIESMEVHNNRELTFHFRRGDDLNANVVVSLGKIAILPEHYWRDRDITQTTTKPPLGSGPYRIADAEQSRFLLYERVPDYWGKNLGINRGRHNFDQIRYDFYRDRTIAREAFRKGLVDFLQETDPRYWNTAYDIPAREKGWIEQRRHNFSTYVGLIQGLAINARRPNLQDVRVREALTLAFDYNWYERVITQGFYTRPESYFSNSSAVAVGLPDKDELAKLNPFRDRLPPRLFTHPFEPPRSSGQGHNRANLLRARQLLQDAGWTIRGSTLSNAKGEPFSLTFIVRTPDEQRSTTHYVEKLQRLGFKVRVRLVEAAQYTSIMKDFDFDFAMQGVGIAQPPTLELVAHFHSNNALVPHTSNRAGIQNDAVDAMITAVLNAQTQTQLIAAQKALDRILLWNFYIIPLIAIEGPRVVYWDKFGRPPIDAEYRTAFPDTWWYDNKKAERIDLAR